MGNDPTSQVMINNGIQMIPHSTNITTNFNGAGEIEFLNPEVNGTAEDKQSKATSGDTRRGSGRNRLKELEGLRASQSFDDSVMLVDTETPNVPVSNSANNKVLHT